MSASVRDGRRASVDIRPRAPVGRDDTRQHDLFGAVGAIDQEPAVDAGLGGPGAHDGRVGTSADEQFDRLDQHRLAGAGLAGERGEAGAEAQHGALDHAQVLDVQLGQHDAGIPDRGRRMRASGVIPDSGEVQEGLWRRLAAKNGARRSRVLS